MITLEEAKAMKEINPEWMKWAEKVKEYRDELETTTTFSARQAELHQKLHELRENIPIMDAAKVVPEPKVV